MKNTLLSIWLLASISLCAPYPAFAYSTGPSYALPVHLTSEKTETLFEHRSHQKDNLPVSQRYAYVSTKNNNDSKEHVSTNLVHRVSSAPKTKEKKKVDAKKGPDISSYSYELKKLQELQRSDTLIKAKIKNLILKNTFNEILSKKDSVLSLKESSSTNANNYRSNRGQSKEKKNLVPVVTSLIGVGKNRSANVYIKGFGNFWIRPGQNMVNGWRVRYVTSKTVVVATRRGTLIALPYMSQ